MPVSVSPAGGVLKSALSSLVFKDPVALSLFSLGEETGIRIIQRLSDRQYLVALKDRTILADSAAPLKDGAELRVRVDKLHPQLVLKILSGMDAPRNLFTENLRLFRANPQGLMTNWGELGQLLGKAALHPSLSPPVLDTVRLLLQSMETLRYTLQTAGDRNFLGNYPGNLGLLLESALKKACTAKGARKPESGSLSGGVKGLLLLLAEKIGASPADDSLDDETRLFVQQVRVSVEKALTSIENQQIINVLLQETQNAHLLQIPLLFPEGMKLCELFVRCDGHNAGSAEGEHAFTAELLLELDALGQLLITVHIHANKLDCLCKCADTGVREFISSHLPELHACLSSAGYHVERLTCVMEQDLAEQTAAWHRQCLLYSGESVNLFA